MNMRCISKVAAYPVFLIASGRDVLAQTPAKAVSEEASYLVWVVFAGAVLIICASGFINPKRSHLG